MARLDRQRPEHRSDLVRWTAERDDRHVGVHGRLEASRAKARDLDAGGDVCGHRFIASGAKPDGGRATRRSLHRGHALRRSGAPPRPGQLPGRDGQGEHRQFALPGAASLWGVACEKGGVATQHWLQAEGPAGKPSPLMLPDADRGPLNAWDQASPRACSTSISASSAPGPVLPVARIAASSVPGAGMAGRGCCWSAGRCRSASAWSHLIGCGPMRRLEVRDRVSGKSLRGCSSACRRGA